MVSRFRVGVSLALVLGLALITADRVLDWHDDVSLWRSAVRVTPTRPRPLLNYGKALLSTAESRADVALALHVTAKGRAQASDPRRSHHKAQIELIADMNRALGLIALQRQDDALALIETMVRNHPTFRPAQRMAQWFYRKARG